MNRFSFRITGESGRGILTLGAIVQDVMDQLGYFLVCEREYPSVIKGGNAAFLFTLSDQKIYSISKNIDFLLALDKQGILSGLPFLKNEGVCLHGYDRAKSLEPIFSEKNISVFGISSFALTQEHSLAPLMRNFVCLGFFAATLDLPFDVFESVMRKRLEDKPFLEDAWKAFLIGSQQRSAKYNIPFVPKKSKTASALLNTHQGLVWGAIQGGLQFFTSYPMTPATHIFGEVERWKKDFDLTVLQADDEIAAAQMVLGAWIGGKKAMTATSGGGFDLMSESVSFAGASEIPFVCVLAQRAGAGTGLPTHTGQEDLLTALYAGHGEFPRLVCAVRSPEQAYQLLPRVFWWAETFRIPVIVLSEKTLADTTITVAVSDFSDLRSDLPSISPDWKKEMPPLISELWKKETPFYLNSDEHTVEGFSTEDKEITRLQHLSREKKLSLLAQTIPEPEIFGREKNSDISFLGFGSSFGVMRDVIDFFADQNVSVNYLHFDVLFPFASSLSKKFVQENNNIHVIESNSRGQFALFLEASLQQSFPKRFSSFDGRRIFLEDVLSYVSQQIS